MNSTIAQRKKPHQNEEIDHCRKTKKEIATMKNSNETTMTKMTTIDRITSKKRSESEIASKAFNSKHRMRT